MYIYTCSSHEPLNQLLFSVGIQQHYYWWKSCFKTQVLGPVRFWFSWSYWSLRSNLYFLLLTLLSFLRWAIRLQNHCFRLLCRVSKITMPWEHKDEQSLHQGLRPQEQVHWWGRAVMHQIWCCWPCIIPWWIDGGRNLYKLLSCRKKCHTAIRASF